MKPGDIFWSEGRCFFLFSHDINNCQIWKEAKYKLQWSMFAEKMIILTLFCHFKNFFFFMFFGLGIVLYKLPYGNTHTHFDSVLGFFFSVDGHHVLLSGEYGQQKCFLKMGFFVLFLCLALEYFGVVRFSSVCLASGFKNIPLVSPYTHTLYTYSICPIHSHRKHTHFH